MGSAVIFSGTKVKTLKSTIDLGGGNDIISSTVDPTSSATSANPGSLLLNSSTGKLYRKNDSGSSTNWTEVGASGQAGINYILNPDAANGTTGWSTYKETDSVTFQDTGDTVTLNSHGIAAGTAISFTSITSTTGISTNTLYYVVNPTTNTFQVATSVGGSALALTTNGSGTMVRSIPKTGSGGSPNITWTRDTTTPLRGSADFNFTKGAANYMGEGVAYSFTIDNADIAKPLSVTFDYELLSGTYTTGDLTVYLIADPSGTPVIIQPAGYQIQNATASTKMRHIATFQTQASGTSYRLVVQVATVSASAYTFALDTIAVGPQYASYGCPVTDWQSYTPTISTPSGSVTNYSSSAKYRRVGDSMEINGIITFSSTSAAFTGIVVSVPSGFTIDSNKAISVRYGSGTVLDAGVALYPLEVIQNTTTTVTLYIENVAGTYGTDVNITNTAPITFNTNDSISFIFTVPITGWSSNVVMSSDTATNVVACVLSGTSTSVTSSGVTITPTTIVNDTNGSFSGSTYTVPVSGYYQIEAYLAGANVAQTSGNGFQVGYKKNAGAAVVFGAQSLTANVTTIMSASGSKVALFNAGDTITFYAIATTTQTPTDFQAGIFRLSGPAVVAASDTVALSYVNTAGTSLTSGTTKIPFATNYFDTHGAWNGTTFTAPISGTYSFQIQLYFASATFTGTLKSIVLYIDGSASRYLAMMFVISSYTNTFAQNGTATIKLNAGQQVHFTSNHNEGTAKSLDTTGGTNFLSIVRVGN
jgi:hypothetical protein